MMSVWSRTQAGRWGLLLGTLLLAGLAQALEPVKPEIDERDYRHLTLDNGLQVLLISDPNADKSAAALDVHIGHNQNPLGREGLAHFLEHMLFLGTEKYPEPDAYQNFISRHGGRHNAYTAPEHTNYYFDIDPDALEPALDRFAQFFIAPLFNADYVERERHAVDSEYKARLKNDARREQDVHRELMNPAHPAARFAVGNLTTLADTEERPLRADLVRFYEQYYSADRMALSVLGNESLDELQSMVKERFKAIPKRDVTLPSSYPPLFAKKRLPLKVEIEPEKEQRQLSLLFPVPSDRSHLGEKPLNYIGHMLGHEGQGSLLSLLKDLGWAENLSAGARHRDRHDALFQVSIELTELGVRATDQIVALAFHTIEQLRRDGVSEWRYRELKQMGEINFRFSEPQPPMETVQRLAYRLHLYAPEDVLRGAYHYRQYDAKLIGTYLDAMRSDNVLISLVAPEVEGEASSSYYQAPFRTRPVESDHPKIKERIQKRLSFPEPNAFIPTRLEVKEAPMLPGPGERGEQSPEHPEKVLDRDRLRVWFQWEDRYAVPKSRMRLRLKLPRVAASAEGAARMELVARLLEDQLNEFAYPAQIAGLDFSLRPHARGLDIDIFGYSSRQNLLFTKIVEALRKGRFDEDRFDDLKNRVIRQWRNEDKETPYAVIAREIPRLHYAPYWRGRDLIEPLEATSLKQLHEFTDSLVKDASVEALLYGNLYRQEAVRLAAYIEHQLLGDVTRRELKPARVYRQQGGEETPWVYRYPLDHDDQVVMLYLQGLSTSPQDAAHMRLLRQILRPAFFHELRTERQLGYVATLFALPLRDQEGTALVVQTPSASVERVWQEMEAFLADGEQYLDENLEDQRSALVRELRKPAKTLQEQSERYWDSLMLGDERFDRRERIAQEVEAITPESLKRYYRQVFVENGRRLWLVTDEADPERSAREISDIIDYQRSLETLIYP